MSASVTAHSGHSEARAKHAARRVAIVGGVAVAAMAVWALWPLAAERSDFARQPGEPVAAGTVETASTSLDLAAFAAPLWFVPPPEAPAPAPPPPPPPPPPLRIQLVGIVSEGGKHRAILFDPDQDRMDTVGAGDVLRRAAGEPTLTVVRVSASAVEFTQAGSTEVRTLVLSPGGGAR